MVTQLDKHFNDLNKQFAVICEAAKANGCECPTAYIINRDGERELKTFHMQQYIQRIGYVPCETRCAWDVQRINKSEVSK
jgi:hypothetical protein